jgi:integrase
LFFDNGGDKVLWKFQKGEHMKRNKTGLYLRGKVYWMSFTANGKAYQRTTGTSDKKLAEKIRAKVITQITEGKWFEIEEKTKKYAFSELAEKYITWANGRQKSFKRWKSYLIANLCEEFGNLPLSNFSTEKLEQYQTKMLNEGNKPATVNRKIAVLSHMFTKAIDWKMINTAPKVKMLKENNKRLRFLSKEECQALINACHSHLKPIVITALHTGMRKGEILNLKWDNVDLRHGFILLNITKNGERREIPINNTLKAILQDLTRRLDIPYVFYDNATGKPYGDIKRAFASACRKAKITDFHFHDLRHTFASQLIMAGVDLTTVKELLGHKTLTMTLRYAHLAPSHKVAAIQKLDGFLNPKTTENKGGKQHDYYNIMTVAKNSLTANA